MGSLISVDLIFVRLAHDKNIVVVISKTSGGVMYLVFTRMPGERYCSVGN